MNVTFTGSCTQPLSNVLVIVWLVAFTRHLDIFLTSNHTSQSQSLTTNARGHQSLGSSHVEPFCVMNHHQISFHIESVSPVGALTNANGVYSVDEFHIHSLCGDIQFFQSLPSTHTQSFQGFHSTGTTIVPPASHCGQVSQSLFIFFHLESTPGVAHESASSVRIHVQYTLSVSGYLTIASFVYVVPPFRSHSQCGDIQSVQFVQFIQSVQSCPGCPVAQGLPVSHWSHCNPLGQVAPAGIPILIV